MQEVLLLARFKATLSYPLALVSRRAYNPYFQFEELIALPDL